MRDVNSSLQRFAYRQPQPIFPTSANEKRFSFPLAMRFFRLIIECGIKRVGRWITFVFAARAFASRVAGSTRRLSAPRPTTPSGCARSFASWKLTIRPAC